MREKNSKSESASIRLSFFLEIILYMMSRTRQIVKLLDKLPKSKQWGAITPCASLSTATGRATLETTTPGTSSSSFSFKNLALMLPPALAGFLGFWQVGRRGEKIGMLESREKMMNDGTMQDVFTVMDLSEDNSGLAEYTPVCASGIYDESKSVFIGPRPRSSMGVTESGYFMVTPLIHKDTGNVVMVLRGWVPAEWKAGKRTRSVENNKLLHHARGAVRYSERPGIFVPKNCPEQGDWFYIDVPGLAVAMGLPKSTPLIEILTDEADIRQSGGKVNPTAMDVLGGRTTMHAANAEKDRETYPLPKSMGDFRHFSVMPQDHLNYAITWFTLSAITSGLGLKVILKGVKK